MSELQVCDDSAKKRVFKKGPYFNKGSFFLFLADFEFHDLLKVCSSSSVLFTLKIIK